MLELSIVKVEIVAQIEQELHRNARKSVHLPGVFQCLAEGLHCSFVPLMSSLELLLCGLDRCSRLLQFVGWPWQGQIE